MPDFERVFTEDGVQLSQLNEIDFINRLPQVCVCLCAPRSRVLNTFDAYAIAK